MKVLLVGVGGVGEAMAVIAKDKPWLEKLVLADYNIERAKEVWDKLGQPANMAVEFVDASDSEQMAALARQYEVDLIHNSVDPVFNEAIFDAAYEVGCNYMDMAMTLSTAHPTDPFNACGVKLGDYQFERAEAWKKKGLLALVGMGVEPGMADVFARYAEKHLFDEIDEIGIRDGANLEVRGYEFAPNFSIWTTIEECLNPPVVWEEGKGWCTTEPFSEPETFEFPEGIGPVECVNVEHEEVLLVPRWVKCKRVTFKYGLGDEFIGVLKTIKMLGLDNRFPIDVKGVQGRAARRGGGLPARPGPPGRPDVRQDLRRHLGQGHQGRQAAPGLPLPGGRQRDLHEKLRRAGGRVADRGQPGHRHGTPAERSVEGRGRPRTRGLRSRSVRRVDAEVRLPVGPQGDVGQSGVERLFLAGSLEPRAVIARSTFRCDASPARMSRR